MTSIHVFWLKDRSLTDLEDLREPEYLLAAQLIENPERGSTAFAKCWLG